MGAYASFSKALNRHAYAQANGRPVPWWADSEADYATFDPATATPEEIAALAGIDFGVEYVPASFLNPITGEEQRLGVGALIRTDNGYVLDNRISDDWNPVSNIEALNIFDDFARNGGLQIETAFEMNNGQDVIVTAKINKEVKIGNSAANDTSLPYIMFHNAHHYGTSLTACQHLTRVVCENTSLVAIGEGKKAGKLIRLNHRNKLVADKVKEQILIWEAGLAAYTDKANFLASKSFDKASLQAFAKEIFPLTSNKNNKDVEKSFSRNALRILDLMDEQPGADKSAGSWYSAFNSVTYFVDHEQGSDNNRTYNSLIGNGMTTKTDAFDLAMQYAMAA